MNHTHALTRIGSVVAAVLAALAMGLAGCSTTNGGAPATSPDHRAAPQPARSRPTASRLPGSPSPGPSLFLAIIVVNDAVTPQHKGYTLAVGTTITFRVSSNHDDVISVQHGPTLKVSADTTIPGTFTPRKPGTYQVKSANPAVLIATLHVHRLPDH